MDQVTERSLEPLPEGFHGDRHLQAVVDALVRRVELFVETGANVGSTLGWVARRYPGLECLSCEPCPEARAVAARFAGVRDGVRVFEETSQAFLARLARDHAARFGAPVLAWLDAHDHGFEWPLRDEVRFLTERFERGFLLIDDFKVPGEPRFGFDAYAGQECAFEHVAGAIAGRVAWRLYYPAYAERTSDFHPLRGWGLLQFAPAGEALEPLERALPGRARLADASDPRAAAAARFAAGDVAGAAERLRAALERDDAGAGLWNDLGVCRAHLGDGAGALEALAAALARDPDDADARANLRDVHRALHPPRDGRAVPVAPGAWGRMARRDPYADLAALVELDAPVVVDGGANRGHTVAKLRDAFPGARTHAFEPIPAAAARLRERFAGDGRVAVHAAALAAETGPVELRVNASDVTSSALAPSALARRYHPGGLAAVERVPVPGVRLGAAVPESIDVLKLDLQGFELEALRGLGGRLGDARCVLCEVELAALYDGQPLFADVDAFLRAAGFRLFHLYDLWSHPDGQTTSGDALYVNERFFAAA